MKHGKWPMLVPVPVGSEYVKLSTGELVKSEGFDERTQLFDIKLPNGERSKIHRREIEKPTPNEVVDFLQSKMRESAN